MPAGLRSFSFRVMALPFKWETMTIRWMDKYPGGRREPSIFKIVRISLSSLFSDYSLGFRNLVVCISFTFDLSVCSDGRGRGNDSNT